MGKIKLTKGELKKQRDGLKRYERYLPTLQLKKQQLQMEILRQTSILTARKHMEAEKVKLSRMWAGLLTDQSVDIRKIVISKKPVINIKNIAGVDVPVFERMDFGVSEYDLFITPLWVDCAVEFVKDIRSLREEIKTIGCGIDILRNELRVTTQRVNLFEKVKIPEAIDTIRRIKIFIGDQMANAVGRSKIAKRKIEASFAQVGI